MADPDISPTTPPLVTPIPVAWVSTGGTGAPNYDEFTSYAEAEALLRANPTSIVAVDLPHCTPEDRAAGRSFRDALPAAPARLAALKAAGHFTRETDAVLPYRIDTPDGPAYGVWAMVRTTEISAAAGDPGRVVRNEEVFADKVRERLALTETTGHLLSAVLLVTATCGDELVGLLRRFTDAQEPATSDTDGHGNTHTVWLMGPGAERERLLGLLDGVELIVADGNHRSLAAQEGGLPEFLAVVAAPESLTIQPYNRLLRELPMPAEQLVDALSAAGFGVTPLDRPADQPAAGHAELYVADGASYDLTLPDSGGNVADRLDHAVIERHLVAGVLGWAPDDPRIAYIGGDHGPAWLRAEVDAGRAAAALLIAPVTTADFVRVNHERLTMPRKSTWFTPKARAGLVLAELGAEPLG